MMKKASLLIMAFLSILFLSCTTQSPLPQTVEGSGQVVSETRQVSGFSGIDLQSAGEVMVAIGSSESVVVEADDNLLPIITTGVKGGRLVIGILPGIRVTTNNPIRITVNMKKLENVTVSGAGSVNVKGLESGAVKFDLPGSGSIAANGKAKSLNAYLQGSGKIDCSGLEVDTAVAYLRGTGEIVVHPIRVLYANISGSGNVNYFGDPASVDQKITGSGKLIKLP